MNQATSGLSPLRYAHLVGRSLMLMPTPIGKPVGKCTKAELDQIEIWHRAVTDVLAQVQESTSGGLAYKLGSVERAMIDQHRAYQRALWRWAIG